MFRAALLASLILSVHLPVFAKSGIYDLPLAARLCDMTAIEAGDNAAGIARFLKQVNRVVYISGSG